MATGVLKMENPPYGCRLNFKTNTTAKLNVFADGYYMFFGRAGYDSTKLAMGLLHKTGNSVYVKNFGVETVTATVDGNEITITAGGGTWAELDFISLFAPMYAGGV